VDSVRKAMVPLNRPLSGLVLKPGTSDEAEAEYIMY